MAVTTTSAPTDAAPGGTTVLADLVLPRDLNHHGTWFGGAGLSFMARAAFLAASRVSGGSVVVAGCDRIAFHAPVSPGDLVEARAQVERMGTRSMAVCVEVTAERPRTGQRRAAISGTFHMVVAAPRTPDLEELPS